ncbi:hypothetical protein DFH06DRAFT_1133590 [Mycena polygramma]|nr:hypothetical protein DFH06DRAFT_1133590 [Mycena polygramma]
MDLFTFPDFDSSRRCICLIDQYPVGSTLFCISRLVYLVLWICILLTGPPLDWDRLFAVHFLQPRPRRFRAPVPPVSSVITIMVPDVPPMPSGVAASAVSLIARGTSTTVAYRRPPFPPEILGMIFAMLFRRGPVFSLPALYDDRRSIMGTCSVFRDVVKSGAIFWAFILVNPLMPLARLEACVNNAARGTFYLLVDLADTSALERRHGFDCIQTFLSDVMAIVAPAFERCAHLELRASGADVIGLMLESMEECAPKSLSTVVTTFPLYDYIDYDPEEFNDYHLAEEPGFSFLFPSAQTLTLTTGVIDNATVVYTSSFEPSAVLTCPDFRLPSWTELMSVLAYSDRLETLVLDNFECSHLPSAITVPAPLAFLHTLELAFRGRPRMAELASRLVLPSIVTLKLVLETRLDIQYAAECRGILAAVEHVVFVGGCSSPHGLEQLFRLMFRVRELDFSQASICVWNEFVSASNIRAPGGLGSNRYACYHLLHLHVAHMDLARVQGALESRFLSGYSNISSVTMYSRGVYHPDSDDLLWFRANSLWATWRSFWAFVTTSGIDFHCLRARASVFSYQRRDPPPLWFRNLGVWSFVAGIWVGCSARVLDRVIVVIRGLDVSFHGIFVLRIAVGSVSRFLTSLAVAAFSLAAQGCGGLSDAACVACSNRSMSTLPCELITLILLFACGDLFPPGDRRHFVRTRRALLNTCRLWRDVVDSCPTFWSRCYFWPYAERSVVNLNVSRFRQSTLDLRVRFEDYYLVRCRSKVPRPAMISPEETLEMVIPYLQNCRSLVLILEDRYAFPMLMRALSRIEGSLLDTLVLTRVVVSAYLTQGAPPFIDTLFFARLPNLRNLYLTRATIGWRLREAFAAVDTLVLDDLSPPYAPTEYELGAAIEAAKGLRRVSLRNVAFPPLSHEDPPLPTFVSRSLREIDLQFDGSSSMSIFVGHLHLPALSAVSVQITSMEDVLCVLHCSALLRSAIDFTVISPAIFADFLFRYPWQRVELLYIFEHLHSVQRLDLARAGPHFFPAMLMGDPNSCICPTLRTVAVTEAVVRHLKEFLQSRSRAGTLSRVSMELYEINRLEDDETEFDLVAALAQPGSLKFDPEYEDRLGWVSFQY